MLNAAPNAVQVLIVVPNMGADQNVVRRWDIVTIVVPVDLRPVVRTAPVMKRGVQMVVVHTVLRIMTQTDKVLRRPTMRLIIVTTDRNMRIVARTIRHSMMANGTAHRDHLTMRITTAITDRNTLTEARITHRIMKPTGMARHRHLCSTLCCISVGTWDTASNAVRSGRRRSLGVTGRVGWDSVPGDIPEWGRTLSDRRPVVPIRWRCSTPITTARSPRKKF